MKLSKFISVFMAAALWTCVTTPGWAAKPSELTDPAAALTPVIPVSDTVPRQVSKISTDSFDLDYNVSPLSKSSGAVPTTIEKAPAADALTLSVVTNLNVNSLNSFGGTLSFASAAAMISTPTLSISPGFNGTLTLSASASQELGLGSAGVSISPVPANGSVSASVSYINSGLISTIIHADPFPVLSEGSVTISGPLVLSPTSTLTISGGNLTILDTGFPVSPSDTGVGMTITSTSTVVPLEATIMDAGPILIIPAETATLPLIGEQKIPEAAVIAEHMKNIAKLLRAHPQIKAGPESRTTERETTLETKVLERSVNQAILETKRTDMESSRTVAQTWKNFRTNILRPAVIEDAEKSGNASKVFAYEQGSLLFGKLLKSEL